jgi:hypothetical protein
LHLWSQSNPSRRSSLSRQWNLLHRSIRLHPWRRFDRLRPSNLSRRSSLSNQLRQLNL